MTATPLQGARRRGEQPVDVIVDLADPALHASEDAPAVFRHLRDHAPLHFNRDGLEPPFWSVTRHADCTAVLRDAARFSSRQTNVLGPHRRRGDPGAGLMLNATDGARHAQLRALVNRGFTARAVAGLEPYLRNIVREALDAALEVGCCDLVDVVAMLPVAGISALLGVPRQDWPLMLELTGTAFGSADGDYQRSPDACATAAQAHGHLLLYCRELMQHAGDDGNLAALAAAERAGTIDEQEALLFFDLLMLGGNETTRHGAVGAVQALLEFPDQWALLRADRSLLPAAVDEVVRFTAPSRHVLRRALEDVELHGRVIRAGDDVVVWHASANRDERVFDNPDTFNIRRPRVRHTGFGLGAHYCLGAALASLELRVFLDQFVERVGGVKTLEPPERLRSAVISGVKRWRVRLEPDESSHRLRGSVRGSDIGKLGTTRPACPGGTKGGEMSHVRRCRS